MRQNKATTATVTPIAGDRLITTREAAAMIGLAPGTLARARVYGTEGYPAYTKLGKAVRYRISTVELFIASQTEYQHTSQTEKTA